MYLNFPPICSFFFFRSICSYNIHRVLEHLSVFSNLLVNLSKAILSRIQKNPKHAVFDKFLIKF